MRWQRSRIAAVAIVTVSPGYRMWLMGQLAIPPKAPPPAPPPDDATKTAKLTDSTTTRSKRAKAKKDPGA